MQIRQFARLAPITLTLLVLIVGYFVLQVLMGVSPERPTSQELIRFGANFLPLTITTEPYRLLTAGFVHIGIMHLLFNGFALYSFGQMAEMAWGRWVYLAVFLLSVIGGNLLNLAHTWYGLPQGGLAIAAGASGGIMGLGSALLVMSLSRHPFSRHLDKKSLFIVMAINLMMGFAVDGIDNAGHIGGAITGLMLGLGIGFLPKMTKPLIMATAVVLAVAFWVLKDSVSTCLSQPTCVLYLL